jgi:hypothetical protein
VGISIMLHSLILFEMTYFAFSNLDSKFSSYGFSEDDKQLIDIMLIIIFWNGSHCVVVC